MRGEVKLRGENKVQNSMVFGNQETLRKDKKKKKQIKSHKNNSRN